MDIVLVTLGSILVLLGLVGCILPILPGPPFSWLGLFLLYFTPYSNLSLKTIIITAVLAVLITIIDFIVPAYATKKVGGSKWGVRGCAIGLILGLCFPPFGILILPFFGALLAELIYYYTSTSPEESKKTNPFISALGSFIGLIFGIVLKLVYSSFIIYLFIKTIISTVF